jgi:hypothetical protein
MNLQSRTFVSLLAGALALASFACGSGSSVTGSTPATGPAPDAPAAVAQPAASGATIAGTVRLSGVGSSAPSGVQALSTTLRVSVVGTSISASTNGAGQFTLTGVPTGHVQLHFEGTGIDARLDLDGLQNGQTLTISVVCSGNQASMDDGRNSGEVEFTGKISAVGSNQLTVSGKTVKTDSSTKVLDEKGAAITLASLKMGDAVSVEGTTQTDGSILATKIRRDNGDGDDDDDDSGGTQQVQFSGTVASVGSGQLMVAGKTVMVGPSTTIVDSKGGKLALTDVKAGDTVDVDGAVQSNGSILASKIKDESQGGGAQQVEFDGKITAIGSGQLTVGGKTVMVDGNTRIVGEDGKTLALTDLKVGDSVQVDGTKQSNGSILASKIQREH